MTGGPGALRDRDQVVERNHLAGIGAHVVAVQVAGVHAERLVGLHKDAIGAVVVVEVVDVLRAHEDVERGGDLRERNAHRLGLLAVDGDQLLRIVGGESGDAGRSDPCARALAPTIWCATRSRSVSVLPPWSCSMNWKPPKLPTPCTAGGWNAATRPPLGTNISICSLGERSAHNVGGRVAFAARADRRAWC